MRAPMLRFRMSSPIVRAHPCARLAQRDALTIASLLPGISGNYLNRSAPMECRMAQL